MRILSATDLLAKSEVAIERAGMMAEQLRAELTLLHVVEPAASERALEQDLQHAIAKVKARSRPPLWTWNKVPDVMVKTGTAANHIIETIDEVRARLVVLGSHRPRAGRDALGGTIAERVLSSRAAPVLIVNRAPRAVYRNVLVALDLSEVSALALRAAESLVINGDARAVVLHAYEPPYEGMLSYTGVSEDAIGEYSRAWARQAQIAVRGLLKQHTRDITRYSVATEQRRPASAILAAADRIRPDLLVMGTRGHGRLRRALLGSVANQVLKASTCDVMIVPDGSVRGAAARRRVHHPARAFRESGRTLRTRSYSSGSAATTSHRSG
jgi:universal stress protein E